jgi:membrane protein implicated in regulation of membrane protease activity
MTQLGWYTLGFAQILLFWIALLAAFILAILLAAKAKMPLTTILLLAVSVLAPFVSWIALKRYRTPLRSQFLREEDKRANAAIKEHLKGQIVGAFFKKPVAPQDETTSEEEK